MPPNFIENEMAEARRLRLEHAATMTPLLKDAELLVGHSGCAEGGSGRTGCYIGRTVAGLIGALAEALAEADDCNPMRKPDEHGISGIIQRPHFAWRESAREALLAAANTDKAVDD